MMTYLEKTKMFNAVILIKSVSNDNKYYSRVFLEKGFI